MAVAADDKPDSRTLATITLPRLGSGPLLAAGIALGQAAVYGSLAARGGYYIDDVANLGAAGQTGPFLGYLTLRLNDHLTPGLRLAYWVLANVAPYEHVVSVLARVAVQLTATVLFYRLLLRLFGSRPATYAALAGYAFCPLTLPSFLSLSSAVNLLPAHVAAILLLDSHVRYTMTGRLRYAAAGGLALLGGVLFWEKIALALGLLPLLSVAVLSQGRVPARLRLLLRSWPAWLLYALPAGAFFGYYFSAGYPTSPSGPTLAAVRSLVWDAWLRSVGPAAAGGPWTWFTTPQTYFGVADPPLAGIVVGQAVLVGLVAAGVWRRGAVSLLCWLMPVLYLIADMTVLAAGRFETFGTLVAENFHYLSDLTIPLVLAAACAITPVSLAAVRDRCGPRLLARTVSLPVSADSPARPPRPAGAGRRARRRARSRSPLLPVTLVLGTVLAAGSSVGATAAAFERRWVQNPIPGFMTTLIGYLRTHPGTNLYDVPLAPGNLVLFAAERRPSQILSPLDLPVTYDEDDPLRPPLLVDHAGVPGSARLLAPANSVENPRLFCSHLIQGATTLEITLDKMAPAEDKLAGDQVVRIDYFMQRGSPVTVRAGTAGRLAEPRGGSRREFHAAGLHSLVLQVSDVHIDRVVLDSANAGLNLCVGHVAVGYPFATPTGS